MSMMCRPGERDLRHAARRALAKARAAGLRDEAELVEAAVAAVAAVWAHVDPAPIRKAVLACLAEEPPPPAPR
jgi:hypothetical protein